MSQDRRLVGIDLGIASSHTVRVLAGDGTEICRRRCEPTVQSLKEIERAALSGAAPGTKLEIIVEPTGPAWLPVAVFFQSRGHIIYRVSSAKAADLRRFLSRHAKSNGIDADTLARLPLLDPAGLRPLELPTLITPNSTAGSESPTGSRNSPPSTRLASRAWSASCCP